MYLIFYWNVNENIKRLISKMDKSFQVDIVDFLIFQLHFSS